MKTMEANWKRDARTIFEAFFEKLSFAIVHFANFFHKYESGYKPAHLSQWEVPKKVREYPRRREGYTIPITDDNGRFLPGVTKLIFKEWSPYEPTWEKDYPRPGSALGTPIKPGYWMIKGRHARWVEAQSIESNNCFEAS